MLKRRIIPCLDVRDGVVVKGVQFRNHEVVGDILELARKYSESGADELVFYDITASIEGRKVDRSWVKRVAEQINIPFCVAGGIRSVDDAAFVLAHGADKISINSPALENPLLISQLAERFGNQCVVVGIDSLRQDGEFRVLQYTGDVQKTLDSRRLMVPWAREVVERGAGEIVLNCMNQDGVRQGYDLLQIEQLCATVKVPVVASGGAGAPEHFRDLFQQTGATGALAASVFHKGILQIQDLKAYLHQEGIAVRI
jgi:cyclase